MLEFARKYYKTFIEIVLILIVAGAVLSGYKTFTTIYDVSHRCTTNNCSHEGRHGVGFLGIIIGFGIGLVITVFVGGSIAIFIKIGEDIGRMADSGKKIVDPKNDSSNDNMIKHKPLGILKSRKYLQSK